MFLFLLNDQSIFKKKKKSVVERSLDHFTGKECDEKIRQATSQVLFQTKLWIHASLFFNEKKKKKIQSMLQTENGTQMVAQMFKTCAPLQSADGNSFFFYFFFRIFFFSLVRFYRKFV